MYTVEEHPFLPGQMALYSNQVIEKGVIVFDVSSLPLQETNNMYAITVAVNGSITYINTVESDVRFTNHSCDPTLFFDVHQLVFISARKIESKEMLTFDYTLTEPEISSPFTCTCGSAKCKGVVGSITSK